MSILVNEVSENLEDSLRLLYIRDHLCRLKDIREITNQRTYNEERLTLG